MLSCDTTDHRKSDTCLRLLSYPKHSVPNGTDCFPHHSVLNALVGLAVAARKDRKLIVTHAKANTATPATKNCVGLITACNVKFCSHRVIRYHVSGVETTSAARINTTNSRTIKTTTLDTDAPNTLRMPI